MGLHGLRAHFPSYNFAEDIETGPGSTRVLFLLMAYTL